MAKKFQLWWGDAELDDGEGRSIIGFPVVTRQGTGQKLVSVQFLLEATDQQALATAWREVVSDFSGRNLRCKLGWVDPEDEEAEPDLWENFAAGDGFAITTTANVSTDPTHASTGYSLRGEVVITAELTAFNDAQGDTTFAGPSGVVGQSGEWRHITTYSTGRIENRVLEATFVALPGGGGEPPAPATSAQEVYEAARSSILSDHMGTNGDGTRNPTTGLCLGLEQVEDVQGDQNTVRVVLHSVYLPTGGPAGSGIRAESLNIESSPVPEWQKDLFGDPPTLLLATGALIYNTDTLAGTMPDRQRRGQAREWVKAQAQAQGFGQPVILNERMTVNDQGALAFEVAMMVFGSTETRGARARRTMGGAHRRIWYAGRREYLQESPLGDLITCTVTIDRDGTTEWTESQFLELARQLRPDAPTGAKWVTQARPQLVTEPKVTLAGSATVVTVQGFAVTWEARQTDAAIEEGDIGGIQGADVQVGQTSTGHGQGAP